MTNGKVVDTEFPASTRKAVAPFALSAALVAIALFSFLFFWLWGHQVEDAAMLFTYSENIAAGEGIVYNPGGERVDGASDLLLALLLAGLKIVGLPVEVGAALVNALSLGFIVYTVWTAWNCLEFGRQWLSLGATAVLLVTTPVFFLGATGFGTLFFAGLVTLVAFLVVRLGDQPTLWQLASIGGVVALVGMDRIEGFALGGAIVFAHGVAIKSLRSVLIPASLAIGVALVWFTWRWSYFGWPLPNPFYKKGGFNPGSLQFSLRYVIVMTAPWLLVLAAGVLFRESRRRALSYSLLIVAPWALLWVLLSNEMNLAGRFQFPVVPVAAVLSSTVGAQVADALRKRSLAGTEGRQLRIGRVSWLALLGVAIVLASGLATRSEIVGLNGLRDASFHQEMAEAINAAAGGSGNLATSEAGMIAWKSDLHVTDLWGLNDKAIAHYGLLKPNAIAALEPDILFSHLGDPESLVQGVTGTEAESWTRMHVYLFCFAQQNSFAPVAVWKGPEESDWWIVLAKDGLPLSSRLTEELSTIAREGEYPATSLDEIPSVDDCSQA